MAQYYNFVTNASGTLTLEEVQRICSIDGQSVQLVVEDINSGGNGSQQFLAYTAAPENSGQAICSQQTINLGNQIATTQLEQGQNVFIIKTNELAGPHDLAKASTVAVHAPCENLVNIVDNRGSKASIDRNNEGQQIQWIKMQENSINLDAVPKQNTLIPEKSSSPTLARNQISNNTGLQPSFQGQTETQPYSGGPTKRKPLRLYQNRNRQLTNSIQSGSSAISPDGVNVAKNSVETRVRKSTSDTPDPRAVTPSPMSKNLLRLQQPEMEHLSERIKQAKLKQLQGQRQMQNEQRASGNVQRQQQANAGGVQAHARQQSQKQQQQQQTASQPIPDSPLSPPLASQGGLDVESPDYLNQEKAHTNQQRSPLQADSESASESIAYLQKIIDNPAHTIVQQQIQGNTAKMLVMLSNGQQRLITFDIPNEDCTVQDLLEQVNITFCGETIVSLVSDPALGINYIVEAGPGTLMAAHEICESVDGNSSQNNLSTNFDNVSHPISSPDENSNPSQQNEEPIYIEGMLAVCSHCGISSLDFNRCLRCKTKFPEDVKSIPMTMGMQEKKENMLSVDTFYKKHNDRNALVKLEKLERDGSACKRGRGRGRGITSRPRPIHKEPECLTISSDEDDEGKNRHTDGTNSNTALSDASNAFSEEMETILEKEPVITNNSVSSASTGYNNTESEDNVKGAGEREEQSLTDNPFPAPHTALLCRTVRIGSYKYVPRERVVISQNGVRFGVPLLEDDKNFVTLDVKFQDIVKVLIHFGKSMPVLFFYTSTSTGAMIRELLGMQDPKGPYYDPAGKDHTHKRITLLPEKLTEESKVVLKSLFLPRQLLEELSPKEANDILVRASPKDSLQVQTLARRHSQAAASSSSNTNVNGGIQTITVYPPPPAKGGIAINTEDYLCLGEDQFLNDVIIDFYLKYLTLEVLTESDQHRTHVFSSYFYKRLTSPHAQATECTVPLSPAAKRHARVQKWTKNVNIFEKDFIVIPINEHAHWFLAIVCFPGLVGKVLAGAATAKSDEPVHKTVQKSKKLKEVKLQAVTIGSTTITPVTATITIDQGDDGSERDEAEGDDEEMEMDSDEEEEAEAQEGGKAAQPKLEQSAMQERDTVRVPCILIFDSLAGASRSRVVATLRDYLSCEHLAKMGSEKTFSKDTIKGASPKVPQQSNFTDCGLYVLQYVESFFKSPIKDYTLPIKTLKNWFEEIVVTRKREELSKLLIRLMNTTKGDRSIGLPLVNFPTQDGKLKPKAENHVDGKSAKPEAEAKRKPTMDGENNRVSNSLPAPAENSEQANDAPNRTTYPIIPYSPCTSSNTTESNPTDMLAELKTPNTRSSSETMSYLKSKRIPRLMLRTENQDDPQAAKKHKGESPAENREPSTSLEPRILLAGPPTCLAAARRQLAADSRLDASERLRNATPPASAALPPRYSQPRLLLYPPVDRPSKLVAWLFKAARRIGRYIFGRCWFRISAKRNRAASRKAANPGIGEYLSSMVWPRSKEDAARAVISRAVEERLSALARNRPNGPLRCPGRDIGTSPPSGQGKRRARKEKGNA
ncbi:hypothetical protein KM043_003863 [Ampulex compressa]|nr:hypothetical protein KM043_003863 [Ampulex compressa]